jgi:hypothetical protein
MSQHNQFKEKDASKLDAKQLREELLYFLSQLMVSPKEKILSLLMVKGKFLANSLLTHGKRKITQGNS